MCPCTKLKLSGRSLARGNKNRSRKRSKEVEEEEYIFCFNGVGKILKINSHY